MSLPRSQKKLITLPRRGCKARPTSLSLTASSFPVLPPWHTDTRGGEAWATGLCWGCLWSSPSQEQPVWQPSSASGLCRGLHPVFRLFRALLSLPAMPGQTGFSAGLAAPHKGWWQQGHPPEYKMRKGLPVLSTPPLPLGYLRKWDCLLFSHGHSLHFLSQHI